MQEGTRHEKEEMPARQVHLHHRHRRLGVHHLSLRHMRRGGMAMSPEERTNTLLDNQPHGYSLDLPLRLAIARAIRAAENDALERVAEAFAVGTSRFHQLIHPNDVAARIRALKHKG
jgi:hypothetical protein